MSDTQDDQGRGELIAALHQVTVFAEGLLALLEKLAEADQRGVSMTEADGERLRTGIVNWRAQLDTFKQRLNSVTITPADRVM